MSDRTPKEIVISYTQSIINTGTSPYSLRTRKVMGISSATAFQTKMAAENINKLSPEEIEELKGMSYVNKRGIAVDFKPYIEKFQQLAGVRQEKTDVKDIGKSKDQYGILAAAIKVKIEDFIVEQEVKIKENITASWTRIHNEYKTLSREDFTKKYGEKRYYHKSENFYYSLTQFYASHLGILLQTPDHLLPMFIEKAQKAYREKEYSKVDGLVYKLKKRFPNLSNFLLTNYRRGVDGIEFRLSADSPEGKFTIYTQTIYAGGYNIQKLHLRWLMHVWDVTGNSTKIEQG